MPVSIYEGEKTVSGGDGIEVTENKVINLILRELNNLIKINSNNEVYVDLQLDDNLQSTATIPVGVNVGRVLQANGFPVTGTLITAKTTSGDTVKVLYGDDGEIRVDNGTGTWKTLQYKLTAGEGIEIGDKIDYSAMRGPCPEGYHVPSWDEYSDLTGTLITTLGLTDSGTTISRYLKMPFAGYRYYSSGATTAKEDTGLYRTAEREDEIGFTLQIHEGPVQQEKGGQQLNYGGSIRGFKDTPVAPDSSWTTLYDGSSIASRAGIYWDEENGLISISGDGINRTTIADKNLGATRVYNYGDTLRQYNCGYYYQWGNCYGFAWDGSVTLSQLNARVDASEYGPGNYYSSDTFFIGTFYPAWDSSNNANLWGGVTGVIRADNVITNTGVLSVNGQTGHVNIESGGLGFALINYDGDLGKMCLQQGELVDNTICYFRNMIASPIGIIYSSDGTEELGEIEEVVPSPGIISFGSDTTGLLKIINGHMIFFPRLAVGGK